ncbi:hypothetical protein CMT41_16440 [Colwellia sp. MT41]|uniref:RNase H1/viroplasmin domain-containing protein n=1 Tax=Colwellia sp. MT41 TaxID=58049 RepID=UPI0007179E43|nr:RNase H1/viroplasmin domain-containing protein [Colwellia sp. MT41]ALO36142.1 hypothetical protein CMT41_16440 [Colwellia sp. MT41]
MLITPIYHVVVNGHIPGIYTSYQEALEQVKDYDDGKLRNYPTMKQARVAWSDYKSIAREKSIAFPVPKKLLLSHSINMGLKATVVLTSVSNPDSNSFTIHRKERRLYKNLDYPFTRTEVEGSINLRSFYQMLLIAKETIHFDESKKVTIFCSGSFITLFSKFAPSWKLNNWLTYLGDVPENIEQVKLIHPLYKQLASQVSFRSVKT